MDCVVDDISIQFSMKMLKQMIFIMNAIENGWTVKKQNDCYIFSNKLSNKREVYDSDFIEKFVCENTDMTLFQQIIQDKE
jgi:hypothetical protein